MEHYSHISMQRYSRSSNQELGVVFNREKGYFSDATRTTTTVGPPQPIGEEAWRGMASRPTTRGPRSKRQAGRGREPSDRARGDGRRRRDTSRRGGGAPPAHMPLRSARAQTSRPVVVAAPVRPPGPSSPPAFRGQGRVVLPPPSHRAPGPAVPVRAPAAPAAIQGPQPLPERTVAS